MASKLCDACKSATAALFCRPDSAFLCLNCDSKIHAANKLASRHPRVWLCEVCEQAPAHVTCKADAAALCVSCDRDIHAANPLARRHDRIPIVPFYDSVSSDSAVKSSSPPIEAVDFLNDRYFADEAEAASWLLPNGAAANNNNNNNKGGATTMDLNTGQFLFHEMDPSYLDLEYVDPKMEAHEQNSSGADGVVPEQINEATAGGNHHQAPMLMNDDHCFDLDFSATVDESKGFPYGYQCLSHSLSSSSMDVGVVPEGSVMTDISNSYSRGVGGMAIGCESASAAAAGSQTTVPLSAAEREARVLRYREKRKNRKFEKTIRYASRKAYAETRPRIKGRFAKRTDADVEADRSMYGFGVVPSF